MPLDDLPRVHTASTVTPGRWRPVSGADATAPAREPGPRALCFVSDLRYLWTFLMSDTDFGPAGTFPALQAGPDGAGEGLATAHSAGARSPVPPWVITDRPAALITVGPAWAVVTVPEDWITLMTDAVGDECGPAFHEPGLGYVAWIVPAGEAETWPGADPVGVSVIRTGDPLFVPHLSGTHMGTRRFRWLISPMKPLTPPARLREAIENITGPLERAQRLGPVRVCRECGAPTRATLPVEDSFSLVAPLRTSHVCAPCWKRWQQGRPGRHLRAVPGTAPSVTDSRTRPVHPSVADG